MKNNSFLGVSIAILMSMILVMNFVPVVNAFANEVVSDNETTDEDLAEANTVSMNSSGTSLTDDETATLSYTNAGQVDSASGSEVPLSDTDELKSYTISANENVYIIRVTKSVTYNGKRHVGKTAKATKKQSPDLTVEVYRNNTLVEPKDYTLKYYNNLNVDNYGVYRTKRRGRVVIRDPIVPYLNVILKDKPLYKNDRKAVATKKVGFTIIPVDISTTNLTVKKVRLTNTDDTINLSLITPMVTIGDKKFQIVPRDANNPQKGFYDASYSDGKIIIDGINNFTGSVVIDLMSAKTMDYIF